MQEMLLKPGSKTRIVLGIIFYGFLGGLLAAAILGLLAFFSLVTFPILSVGIILLYVPAIIAGVLGGAYIFLREEPIPKVKLRKSYRQLILLILFGYLIFMASEILFRVQVRTQHQLFTDALYSNDYSTAYQYTTEEYRSKHLLTEFIDNSHLFFHDPRDSSGENLESLNLLWDVNVYNFGRKAEIHLSPNPDWGGFETFVWERDGNNWLFTGEIIWNYGD